MFNKKRKGMQLKKVMKWKVVMKDKNVYKLFPTEKRITFIINIHGSRIINGI